MKEIPLTNGPIAIVDDEDFEFLNQWQGHSVRGYAPRREYFTEKKYHYKSRSFRMHRIILNAPDGYEVDHINGNPLDNRKSNIRICTRQQNMRNVKLSTKNTSGYKGVSWSAIGKKWMAYISYGNKKTKYLGYYTDKKDAAYAYDSAAKVMFGEFAKLNFPMAGEEV